MKLCLSCGEQFESNDWRCPRCGLSPETINGYLAFSPDLADENVFFSIEYFNQLFRLEAKHFWFTSRNRLLVWAFHHYFPHARIFLEIGCGTGFVLYSLRQEFKNLILSGSDIFIDALEFAKKRLPDISLYQMDAHNIPFDGEFDVIGAFDILEHIDEDDAILRQMFRAIKPGGGIIITVPQHRFLWSVVDEYSFHKRRYTRKELLEKIERAGFAIKRATSFVSFLLPLLLLSRLKWRKSKTKFDPLTELKIGHFLNFTLEMVMGIERRLIERGYSFPVGGSLIVVAKRNRGDN
jgi:SAM-dependent methyltransferase